MQLAFVKPVLYFHTTGKSNQTHLEKGNQTLIACEVFVEHIQ